MHHFVKQLKLRMYICILPYAMKHIVPLCKFLCYCILLMLSCLFSCSCIYVIYIVCMHICMMQYQCFFLYIYTYVQCTYVCFQGTAEKQHLFADVIILVKQQIKRTFKGENFCS